MPLIVSKSTEGTVEKWHKVELACNTDGAMIVFTTDGSVPELHGATTKVSVCLSVCRSVCPSARPPVCLSVGLSFCRSVLSVGLS